MMIGAAFGFLFLAAVELLLMRIQLVIPENTFLTPETFNRLLSVYGATSIFLFALPLALGVFYYVVPLQIGARGTALPRLGQIGLWFYIAGATVLYVTFLYTPPEAGTNPLPPLSEIAFIANNGVDAWLVATAMVTLGLGLLLDRPRGHAAKHARPGDGLAPPADLLLGRRGLRLADDRDRADPAGGADDAGDRPQLRRDLLLRRGRRAAALAAPELDLLHRRPTCW